MYATIKARHCNGSGRSAGRRLYGLSVLLSQFGVPALISSMCYWLISRVMSSQLERRRGHTLLKESEEKKVNRKTQANRMMIAMVLGFIFAWMPLNASNLYRDWGSFSQQALVLDGERSNSAF
ncbi:hypothetical protein Q1695_006926 [Nippostrongylus brasiliensis]|nr:hypothetical protein Q1695_006926 [Nippostrongylus brasiliensis]